MTSTTTPASREAPSHLVLTDAQRLAREVVRAVKDLEKKVRDLTQAAERLADASSGYEADSAAVYTRTGTLVRASFELFGLAGKCAGLYAACGLLDAERPLRAGRAQGREP